MTNDFLTLFSKIRERSWNYDKHSSISFHNCKDVVGFYSSEHQIRLCPLFLSKSCCRN